MKREHEGEIKCKGKMEKLKHNHLRCFSDGKWMMKEHPGSGWKANSVDAEPLKICWEKAELPAGCVCVHVPVCMSTVL